MSGSAAPWRAAPLALLALAWAGPAPAAGARCWIDHGALVAAAAFGDIAGDFLIDLAAPHSLLQESRALADGVETPTLTRDLVVAGRRVAAVEMTVQSLDARTRHFDTDINGVIGADVLGRYVVDLDPGADCRFSLSDPAARLARPPRGAVSLPVTVVGGRPLVEATLTDGARIRPGLFALGTADWRTVIAGARLSRSPPEGAAAPARLRGVEVAGRLFEQVPAVTAPASGDEAHGAIGLSVWSRWRLRLDPAAGRLDLTPLDPGDP